MSLSGNRISQILAKWWPLKDKQQWVLGIVTEIKGSSYRKPGAIMLFGELGQQLGLLSGGCLEADLMRHARMVMDSQREKYVTYDMTDEDDIGWQLGIGCGGMVKVLLLPIDTGNIAACLASVYQSVSLGASGKLIVPLTGDDSENTNLEWEEHSDLPKKAMQVSINAIKSLLIPIFPAPHIVVFGGGIDAIPVAQLAASLGWFVSIVDKRTAYARAPQFTMAEVFKVSPEDPTVLALLNKADAAIIMNHNLQMDADSLLAAHGARLQYLALLGPNHRRDKILAQIGMTSSDFLVPLSSPAGLDIGGEIPESIALSILAECHAVIEGGKSLANLRFATQQKL